MTTGYKTILPIQIGNLLYALAERKITWSAARVWFACLEMVAIREAAQRVRRQRRDMRKVSPEYTRVELMELTGLNSRAIGKALAALRTRGLIEFSTKSIRVVDDWMPEAGETIHTISGGRSPKRPIPVPRAVLRFLAQQSSAGLGKVMLGYICRGLTIERKGGAIRPAGTVKASWLADTLGLSLRTVRYAQAQLRRLGWIGKDIGSKQRKLNRHGSWFQINLQWQPRLKSGGVKPVIACRQIAPLPTRNCTPVAPPKEDRKTPSESKNQKSGVFRTGTNTHQPPRLSNIRIEDLRDAGRLRALHLLAVAGQWVRDCESDRLNFLAAAVRARTTPSRDPVRVFVSLVRNRRWNHLTHSHEDEARRLLRAESVSLQREASPQLVGNLVGSLLQGIAGRKNDLPHRKRFQPEQTPLSAHCLKSASHAYLDGRNMEPI